MNFRRMCGQFLAVFAVGLVLAAYHGATSPTYAQGKELSERAKGLDTNKDSLIQESEARGPLAANFPEMDCDKNGGLDGAEIRGFFTGAGCPETPAASASTAPAKKTIPPLGERAKALDANNDNLIQKSEARGPLAANFPEMDCDKNSGLDQDEIRGFFTGTGCPEVPAASADTAPVKKTIPPLGERAKALDINEDNLIQESEARGPLAANFAEMDCDKNGGLDQDEIRGFFTGAGCPKAPAGAATAAKPSQQASKAPGGRRSGGRPGGGGRPPQAVRLDEVIYETSEETYAIIGRVIALQQGPIASRVNGPIASINVKVGDRVKKGDTLVSLSKSRYEADRRRIAAQVARQKTALKNAERELRRMKNLSKSAAFSRARFEDQEGIVAERKAQLAEFNAALQKVLIDIRDATIKAPYDAVVLAKNVELGGYVNVGAPVVRLINETALEIEVDVPAFRMDELKPGASAAIVADNGKEYPAFVKSIIPNDNTRTRTRPVRLIASFGLDALRFANNQSVSVKLPLSSGSRILTIHKDAVVSRANGSVVFVVKGTNATMRNVKLGRGIGNKFEILHGLKPGEKVVVRGNERLGAGAPIRVVN